MTDPHTKALETLRSLEQEQIERYRPAPPDEGPKTPAEAYLAKLNASVSRSISLDSGWLR